MIKKCLNCDENFEYKHGGQVKFCNTCKPLIKLMQTLLHQKKYFISKKLTHKKCVNCDVIFKVNTNATKYCAECKPIMERLSRGYFPTEFKTCLNCNNKIEGSTHDKFCKECRLIIIRLKTNLAYKENILIRNQRKIYNKKHQNRQNELRRLKHVSLNKNQKIIYVQKRKEYNKIHKQRILELKKQLYINLKQTKPYLLFWNSARQRCLYSKDEKAKYYKDKGIKFLLSKFDIKSLWFRDGADKMTRPSLHRKDNNGNYSKNNCEFLEFKEHMSLHAKDKKHPMHLNRKRRLYE